MSLLKTTIRENYGRRKHWKSEKKTQIKKEKKGRKLLGARTRKEKERGRRNVFLKKLLTFDFLTKGIFCKFNELLGAPSNAQELIIS